MEKEILKIFKKGKNMGKESKYAVVGNPVAHSLSPEIHEAFAKQFGDNISYEKIEIPLGEFESYIEYLISEDIRVSM